MKLSIATSEPKPPKEKEFEFSLVENGGAIGVKVSVDGGTPIQLVSFTKNPYENKKVHMVRNLVNKDDFSTDGYGQISYASTSELNKY
jgi:hypothetical protein